MNNKIIPAMVCALFMSGCSQSQFDVLDKIADMHTVGKSISQQVNKEIEKEKSNVEFFVKSISSDEAEKLGPRPDYDPLEYVDLSQCDITKIKPSSPDPVTDDEVMDSIHNLMLEQQIFSNTDTSKNEDVVTIAYTATEEGQTLPYVDVKEEDMIVGKNLFPKEVDEKLVGVKPGDVIDTTYTFAADYYDETYCGKTFNYHIEIKAVKGMNLTIDVINQISNSSYKSVEEYVEFCKSMLENKRKEEFVIDMQEQLIDLCIVNSVPKNVLEYDIKAFSDIDGEPSKNTIKNIRNNLIREMKIRALASKYNINPEVSEY